MSDPPGARTQDSNTSRIRGQPLEPPGRSCPPVIADAAGWEPYRTCMIYNSLSTYSWTGSVYPHTGQAKGCDLYHDDRLREGFDLMRAAWASLFRKKFVRGWPHWVTLIGETDKFCVDRHIFWVCSYFTDPEQCLIPAEVRIQMIHQHID